MHRHISKSIKSAVLVTLAVLVVLLPLGGCDYKDDAKQWMENLAINAQLTENGDMKVQETWKVDLENRDKVYRNLYRTFPVESEKADGIADLAVYDEDSKTQYRYIGDIDPLDSDSAPDNSCYMHQTGSQVEIGWFMPEIEEGIRTFTISYTVKNIVAVHGDTAEFYNFFVPKNFSLPIGNLACTVSFPSGGEKSALRAWLHTTANGNLTIDSANRISFTVKEIPAKTSIEVRLCTPPQLFSASARRDSSSVLAGIIAQEQKWADEYKAKQFRQYLLGIIDASSAVLLFLGAIVLFILAKNKNKRLTVDVPEYTREIPPGNSPGGIANLYYYYKGGISDKVRGKIFSATMLSLARKGYIRFGGTDEDNLSVTMTGNSKNIPLTESEQEFLNMISTVASGFDGSFTMNQFKNYAKIHFKYIDSSIESFLTSAKREIARRDYYRAKPALLSAAKAIGCVFFSLSLIILFSSAALKGLFIYLPLSLLVSGLILFIAGSGKQKLSEKGEYDYGVWHGLEKYMLEFSRMTEYGVPQLELWEEYLVYATMMGISKNVCEQLRMVYPQLNDSAYLDTFGGSYMHYMFLDHMGGRGFGGWGDDFGSTLASTISDVSTAATRLAHPPEQGNGGFGGGGFGGGSFGGGGGGFGGGGGGGVR
ncbi:MAG TPA: DUF2207 domain-containing protein [Caproiciproducens sp.]|nr:DUF2207 domain-containing protein [Caproiciproducens sp.]